MSSVCRLALLAVAMLLFSGSWASAAPPPPPTKEQIARWVEQLGDKDFNKREEASKRLWEAGEPAEKAVEAAAKSDDAEVARRAKELLEKFKWGIYPDTPKNVADLIGRYQGADANGKNQVMRELIDEGVNGCRALVKIAAVEDDAMLRAQILRVIGANVARFLPLAMADNKYDMVEKLLDLALQEPDLTKKNISNYCAYWLFQGKLDDRVNELKDKKDRTKQQSELLAYLYRARGDLPAAKEVAEKADMPELVDRLLYELGDWKTLAKRDLAEMPLGGPEHLSYRLAYHRLAGNAKEFDETLAEFRKIVMDAPPNERSIQAFYLAKALFINNRPAEAMEVLESNGHYAMLFELLCVQFKYKEAFALVDKARAEGHKDLPLLEIYQARNLYELGEKEKSLALFASRAAEFKMGNEISWYGNLIEAEYRVGLKDQAFEHAAKVLDVPHDVIWQSPLFATLFPGKASPAHVWITYFRMRAPNAPPAQTMKKVRELFDGKLSQLDLTALIEDAQQAIKDVGANDTERWWLALADAAQSGKLDKLYRSCLEKASSSAALLQLGDLLAEKKEWTQAAEQYRKAWEKAASNPLPLFLAGKALVQAGQEKEGQKLMEQSRWLPLGDDVARSNFATALSQRGYADAAHRENELTMRLGQAGSYYPDEAERRLAFEAYLKKDYLKAAAGQDHTLLRCLKPYVRFLQNPAYLGVPTLAHRFRACGLVDAMKFDDAKQEIAYCRSALPGDVELAILVVPELERLGRKKDADDLFTQTAAVFEKMNETYPNSATMHNSLAWLSVCCRRDLEKALEHAKKGVTLAPANAGHYDTLAEVYFQLGDKEKAIAEQKKAIELDPKKAYFRKQLKRIEAGDPKAERPPELGPED